MNKEKIRKPYKNSYTIKKQFAQDILLHLESDKKKKEWDEGVTYFYVHLLHNFDLIDDGKEEVESQAYVLLWICISICCAAVAQTNITNILWWESIVFGIIMGIAIVGGILTLKEGEEE